MRVLVADRNVRLLESISLTFSHQFSIYTASDLTRCAELLQEEAFDLVIVGEKLGDGPGLSLLGQIARNWPGTLRVFAARDSRLQLLKGKLGPFGLFRTLSYPIDPGRLLATFQASAVSRVSPPARPSRSQRLALLLARLQPPKLVPPRPQATPVVAPPIPIPTPQLTPEPAPPPPPPQIAVARPQAPQPAPSLPSPRIVATVHQPPRHTKPAEVPPPKRSAFFLGAAAMVSVFTIAVLTLRPFDTPARSSDTPAVVVKASHGFAPLPESTPNAPMIPARIPPPLAAAPQVTPAKVDVTASESQMTTDNVPIADPSTFGTEASEPIYAN